ncbi:MAG TPA: response regulator [Anaerolineales bacterium]|nr:response regulator [Anaerolineales bacterium]
MSKILVVDDNTDLLGLIDLKLSQEGYTVILADNGFDGLARSVESDPDLIILDVMMPEMDGWELLERIRETSNVPILMLTAKSEDEDVIKGLGLGADEYLTKPFRLNTLSARIEALLRRRTWEETGVMAGVEALKKHIVAALSQELRTPVALILNALDLSIREAFKNDREARRTFIIEARENAESLRWLIEDLLLLVRIDEGLELLVRPTFLHNLLHRMIARMENTLTARGLQARLIIEDEVSVLVDQVLLRQALFHLFENSITQAPDRSHVMVMVAETREGLVHIDFHDQGAGVPETLQEQIFERFYQLPRNDTWKRNGLGVGLYIAREIARSHGGDVTVHSKTGEGSTFRLTIPKGITGIID